MAIKTIKFGTGSGGQNTLVADGANGLRLPTGTELGAYPQTISGITCGWSPNNNSGISSGSNHSVAAPFEFSTVSAGGGTGERRMRVDRAAGTFVVKMQTYMPEVTYLSTALRIIDSDGSTVLYAQNGGTVVNRDNDGIGNRQCNTNGSMQTVGTADAGASITTTGAFFFVEWGNTGTFSTRLTYFEFDDGVTGGSAPTVSSISPTSGPVGTQVTFTGTNLGGTSLANVNGTAMTGILNDSATQVRATVGAGSTTGATGLTATGGSVTGGPTFTVTTPPPTRTGFRVVSGYPALGSIPINAVLTPPLVLQATAAGPVDTTDGDGTTVTIGIDIVLTGAEVVSGGTAVQSGGLVTFSSLVLRPVTSLLGTLAVPAAIGFATFAGLRIRFQ
jgi:hypothetical protein